MRNHEIKLVVCDLDDTLLNDQKIITEHTQRVLEKVKKMGIAVCFASGRDAQMMSVYDKQIGGCDYVLSNNGAMVHDRAKRIVHNRFLSEQDTADILTYLNDQQMAFMMYSAEEMYFSEGSQQLKKRIDSYEALSAKIGCPVKLKVKAFCRNSAVTGFETAAKIVAYEKETAGLEAFMRFLKTLPDVHCESTGYGLMGAFQKEVSKKTALQRIMQDMGILPANVCVFGDFDNDLSMFECAKYRVCMANGVQPLKDAASSITRSNNEDGVACYLEKELDIR